MDDSGSSGFKWSSVGCDVSSLTDQYIIDVYASRTFETCCTAIDCLLNTRATHEIRGCTLMVIIPGGSGRGA